MMKLIQWCTENWVEIIATLTALNMFAKALRAAWDKTPQTDDNAWEKAQTFISGFISYIVMGKREVNS